MQADADHPSAATQSVAVRMSTIEELLAGGGTLFDAHYREISRVQHLARLRPDWGRLKQMERQRSLIVLGAWAGTTMVGYSVAIIGPSLHYSDLVCAHVDALFVAQPYRRCGVGLELIRETERVAVARGARRVTMHAKPRTRLEVLLPHLGYQVEETILAKDFPETL